MRITFLLLGLVLLFGCSQKTSEEHVSAAQAFIAEERMESAVVELKNAIQKDPKSAIARFELGRAYTALKQYESAEKELNRALEFGHPASEVIPLLSQSYQKTGAYAALSEIDHTEAGMTPEQEVEVGFFKLQSLLQLEKLDEANALIIELEKIQATSVYAGLVPVYKKLIAQDNEGAFDSISQLSEQYPESPELLKLKGQLLLRLSRIDEAAEVYKKYVEVYPSDTQTKFVLAKLLVDNAKPLEAEPYVDQLLEINAENPLLNQLKGVISAVKENYPDAQSYSEKAIQSGRGDPVLRLIAGYAAYLQQDYEAANRHLSFIASSLPADHPGMKMLAASQLELGMSDDASDVLANLEELNEQDAKLFSKTGYELIRSGNIKEAKEVVERSAQISQSAEDLTRLGVLRLSLNDVDGIIDLEKALEKSPELDVTKTTLANAYLATNQLDKAEQLAMDWKATNPDDFKAYMLQGEIYAKRQDYDNAVIEYSKAKELSEDNGLVVLALANIDLLRGNTAEGEARLNGLLEKRPDFVPALASYYLLKKKEQQGKEGMQPTLDAVKTNPERKDLQLLLGRMHLSENEFAKVIEVTKNIEENEETPLTYWALKGKALLGLGDANQAEDHYDKWLALVPNNKEANVGKLLILDAQNKFAEGAKLSTAYLEKADDMAVRIMQVHFSVMAGQFEKASELYEKLPLQTRDLPVVKGFKARMLLSEQQNQEALPLSEEVYKNIPNSRNLVLLVGNLERLEKSQESLALIQSHAEKYPQDIAAKMLLAERQITANENSAIKTYEETLKLNPNNFVVLNNLAYLYTQEGRLAEAEKYARQAVEQRPDNADAIDTLAQALAKQKKYEEAIKFYDRAVNAEMRNEEIYLNYVETLANNGNINLARRKLTERKFTSEGSEARIIDLRKKFSI